MFKLQDFECQDCNHITEILQDSTDKDIPVCEECKSINLKPVLGTGTGKKSHVSWSKWRTP